ncbi:MAG: hypothetical protein RSA04_00610 [Clostridiales bacterium]
MIKRKFSNREKIMILVLGCLVFFTLMIAFVIMPGMDKLSALKQNLQEAKTQEIEMKTAINNKDDIENSLDNIKADVEQYASVYYAPMEPEEADVVVSGMVARYGFTPTTLEIQPAAETVIIPYSQAQKNSTKNNGETVTDTTVDTSEKTKESPYSLTAYEVTITANGTGNQFPALCAEICLNPSMHLMSYAIETAETKEDVRDSAGTVTSTITKLSYVVTATIQLFSYKSYSDAELKDLNENINMPTTPDPGANTSGNGAITTPDTSAQGNGAVNNGTVNNGTANNGTANNGTTNNGTVNNGAANNGTVNNGVANNGTANGVNDDTPTPFER